MNMYEILGRKEAELQAVKQQRDAAIKMVRDLKDGTIALDDVEVVSVGPESVTEPVTASANGAKPDGD